MYDQAISLAKEHEYINEEALANELAAKFYLEWGKQKIAQTYLTDAYYNYVRWGAKAKLTSRTRYPQLLAPSCIRSKPARIRAKQLSPPAVNHPYLTGIEQLSSSTSVWGLVDLPTVIKASQALSSEIKLDQLLTPSCKWW